MKKILASGVVLLSAVASFNASAESQIELGKAAVAKFNCASCHGNDGRGDTQLGRNMYPGVPSFADETVQRLSDGELFYIIQNGVRWTGMPAWKDEHSAEDSWRLVSLIRAMPNLTPADLDSAGLGAPSEQHDEHHHEHERDDEAHPPFGR